MFKCEKCGSELEPNAKFCTNCGEQVSENVKTEMKNDQPSSKVKTWVLKAVAFFIAAFVFTIARVIFTAINGGSMDGKSTITALPLLLFIGMYILFKGLFLKDSSAKKTGGWILGICIVLSIAFTYYMNNSNYGLESQIMRMNSSAPVKIDSETELMGAKLNGNNVDIKYRLINYSANDIPYENRSELKNELKSSFCSDSGYKRIMSFGKGINVYVYGKYKREILNLYLSKSNCR